MDNSNCFFFFCCLLMGKVQLGCVSLSQYVLPGMKAASYVTKYMSMHLRKCIDFAGSPALRNMAICSCNKLQNESVCSSFEW